jgi:hypothetical protein
MYGETRWVKKPSQYRLLYFGAEPHPMAIDLRRVRSSEILGQEMKALFVFLKEHCVNLDPNLRIFLPFTSRKVLILGLTRVKIYHIVPHHPFT